MDALLRMDKEDHGMGSRGGHSGIPVHFSGASGRAHSESLAGVDSSPGFRALPRVGLPLPCQTFPACRNGGRRTLGARLTHEQNISHLRHLSLFFVSLGEGGGGGGLIKLLICSLLPANRMSLAGETKQSTK